MTVEKKFFLIYDDIAEHFDAITNIKAFMACDHFGFKRFKTFTDNEAFDNHVCGLCVKAKKRKVRHEKKSGVSKGGQDEIAFRTQKI